MPEPIKPAPARVTVVDTENLTPGGLANFYGVFDWAVAQAERYVDTLADAETGRYGIDAAIHCADCTDYHSPEADCA